MTGMAQAREIVANSPDLRQLFSCELYNEGEGGVSPATLSSAVDSLEQAPHDVVRILFTEDPAGDPIQGFLDLIRVLMLVDAGTELRTLL